MRCLLFLTTVLMCLGIAGCGSGSDQEETDPSDDDRGQIQVIEVEVSGTAGGAGFAYTPATVNVNSTAGKEVIVRYINQTTAAHRVLGRSSLGGGRGAVNFDKNLAAGAGRQVSVVIPGLTLVQTVKVSDPMPGAGHNKETMTIVIR